MADMSDPQYMEGYNAATNFVAWTQCPYPPGSREFHEWLEGHSDGLKSLFMGASPSGVKRHRTR